MTGDIMTMLESGACANCGRAISDLEQKFCPACGQPTPAHRLDWHFLGHELEHSVLHMDRGILYSLKELMLRPGHLIRNYLDGRRARQVKPLLLLMISAAAVLFLGKYLLGGDVIGTAMQAGYSQGSGTEASQNIDPALLPNTFVVVKDWINAHLAAFTLILLPFEAAAFWLAFKGRGLNYPEWLVVSAFLTVQAFIFMGLAVLLQRWLPSAQAWATALASVYVVFSLVQFFRDHSGWTTALRSIVGLGLFVIVQAIVTVILVVVVTLVSGKG